MPKLLKCRHKPSFEENASQFPIKTTVHENVKKMVEEGRYEIPSVVRGGNHSMFSSVKIRPEIKKARKAAKKTDRNPVSE